MKKNKTPATTTNPALLPIEVATKDVAACQAAIKAQLTSYEHELSLLQQRYLPTIRANAHDYTLCKIKLEGLITANAQLFAEPRTVILHGIKVGLQKGKGSIQWDDEDKVIARIRKHCSEDQADLLIETKASVVKNALLGLEADTLKKLGVTISGTGDQVVIKSATTDLDKVLAKLLEEPASTKGKKEKKAA